MCVHFRAGAWPASGGVKKLKKEKTDDACSDSAEHDGELVVKEDIEEIVTHIDGTVDESNAGISAILAADDGAVVAREDSNAIYEILNKSGTSDQYYVIVSNDGNEEELGEEHTEEDGAIDEGQSSDGDPEGRKVHCPHCGMSFPKVSYLQVHMRKHTGEKPFECDRCGRGFSQRANLQRHVQGHVGEKPYLCYMCGKSFIQKIQLTTHLAQSHSGDDGSPLAASGKRFKCRICHHVFAERGHLRQHAVKAHPDAHREAVGGRLCG